MRTYVTLLLLLAAPVSALAQNSPCKFLCEPTFLVEPTITFEKNATVFETVFALDLSTPIPRIGVSLEAITKPFSDDNDVELESELNLYWLESEQTRGWASSHFDFVDKFSGTERTTDTRAYTHKLNFELDTAVAVFNSLVVFCGIRHSSHQRRIKAIPPTRSRNDVELRCYSGTP